MKIEKAHWDVDGDSLRMTMPLTKIDKERRMVSGFATVDSPDTQNDIVSKDASKKAFEGFRGNIRLMHQPIPAGKLVNFREEQVYDKKTNKMYNGIYVDTYISKGAENIWQMVLDGTLTGFSIGGSIKKARSEFNKDVGENYRIVEDYEMVELSLVDSPANQLSNIVSIQKSVDGTTVEGPLAEMDIENVFYCKKDHEPVAQVGPEENKDCVECGSAMTNIGWFETDGGDKAEKVNAAIAKFESTEGGENVADNENKEGTDKQYGVEAGEEQSKTVESTEEVSPKGDDNVIAPEEETEESDTATNVEDANVSVTGTGEVKVEEAEEVVKPEFEDGKTVEGGDPVTKALDAFSATISSALEKNGKDTASAIADLTTHFEKQVSELNVKHQDLSAKLGALTEKLDGVEKSIDAVEKAGAFKKSADLGGSEESTSLKKGTTSKWGGAFFSVGQLD